MRLASRKRTTSSRQHDRQLVRLTRIGDALRNSIMAERHTVEKQQRTSSGTVATTRRPTAGLTFISGQKREMMPKVKRELRRRPAVESKAQHRHGAATMFGPSRAPLPTPSSPPPASNFPFPLHPLAHYFVAPHRHCSTAALQPVPV